MPAGFLFPWKLDFSNFLPLTDLKKAIQKVIVEESETDK